MQFPRLRYSPERQTFLRIVGVYHREHTVQDILFWEGETEH